MRKCILLFLFLNLNQLAFNQIIRGTVSDETSHEKIIFAYIYFNGTVTGTNTNQNGEFELDISKNTSMPLTISAIGYHTVSLAPGSLVNPVMVLLKPKIYNLDDVEVTGESLARKRKVNLRIFRNAFLGSTDNAKQCEILNESDIKFNYGSDKDTLKAFASKALIINNRALGYKITYFLDDFELYKNRNNSFYFSGTIIFKDELRTDQTEELLIESNRAEAYFGSRMHFMRALWQNKLEYTGFKIKDSQDIWLNYNNIVSQEDSLIKFIRYSKKLGICYNSGLPGSFIYLTGEDVYFEKNGYFDPAGIVWEGKMSEQRIADWLPYEYLAR